MQPPLEFDSPLILIRFSFLLVPTHAGRPPPHMHVDVVRAGIRHPPLLQSDVVDANLALLSATPVFDLPCIVLFLGCLGLWWAGFTPPFQVARPFSPIPKMPLLLLLRRVLTGPPALLILFCPEHRRGGTPSFLHGTCGYLWHILCHLLFVCTTFVVGHLPSFPPPIFLGLIFARSCVLRFYSCLLGVNPTSFWLAT